MDIRKLRVLGTLEGTSKTNVPAYKARHPGVWARWAPGHVVFAFALE